MGIQINGSTDRITAIDGTIDFVSNIGNIGLITASNYVLQDAITIGAGSTIIKTVNGNIGIGTDGPTDTLHISKVANHGITLDRPAGGSNPGSASIKVHSHGALVATSANNITYTSGGSNNHIFNRGSDESLRITSAGKLGIGTITPGDLVHINTTGNVGGIRFGNGQNLNAGTIRSNWNSIDLIADQNLTFQTNSNTRMKITNSGSVGINTDAPQNSAHFQHFQSTVRHQSFQSTNGDLAIITDNNTNPAVYIKGTGTADLLNVFDNNTEVFTIIDGGKVGINETAPDRTLHVKSGANSNDGALRIESANNNIMDIGTDGSMHFLNCVNDDPFRIKFAGNEAIRITQETSGNWTTTLQFNMETNNGQGAQPYIRGVAGTESNGSDSQNAGGLEFHSKTGGSGTDVNAMRISHDGKVSIGAHNIQAPTAALHIIGDTSGSNTALQVGKDSDARYFRVNELSGQSNFGDVTLSFYDNSLAAVLKLQNTYAATANMGTAIQFIGHGGGQTGKISVYNRDVNTASNSIMELSASYVTKPSQPSFHIGSPYNSGMSSGNVWKSHSNAIYSNVGNHYDNSTGRFTAPVAGNYFFFHWAMSNSSGQTNDVYSRKNGSRDQIGTSYNQSSGAQHNQYGCSYIRTLAAGDYVDVYLSNGNTYATTDGRHGGWGGWLIG